MNPRPKIFISYSHDSPEHMKRVLELSDKLRLDGIDCSIDQYEESPEEGWPKWIEKNIVNADYVLVVCTKTYRDRSMDEETKGRGKGVKYESSIIYQIIYDDDSKNRKIIPIIFNDDDKGYISLPLKSTTFYRVFQDDDYEKLYNYLIKRGTIKPKLGPLKPLPEKSPEATFIEDTALGIQALNWNTPTINLLNYASTAGRTLGWNSAEKIYTPTTNYGTSGIFEYYENKYDEHPVDACCIDPNCPYCHDYDCCSGINCNICNHDIVNCHRENCEICNHGCTFCQRRNCGLCKHLGITNHN